MSDRRPVALTFGGGLALGAYHHGALDVLAPTVTIDAVAGSSIGAITAAIVAGNPPDRRGERLAAFWERVTSGASAVIDPFGVSATGPLRKARNWSSAAAGRLGGAIGLFRPRLESGAWTGLGSSIYDLSELADTLRDHVDFELLNGGGVRCCIAATDVETGQAVLFDTRAGDVIGPEHILASSALIPNFAAVPIGDRLLADGGLSANVPLEPFLAASADAPLPSLVLALDLFAPDAGPPRSIEEAAARAVELQFAAQTGMRIAALSRERALAAEAGRQDATDLLWLSYRAPAHEAGPEKQFDFSRATLADRRRAGMAHAAAALDLIETLPPPGPGLRVHRIRAG